MIGYYVKGDRDRCQRVTAPSKKEETLQTKEAGIFLNVVNTEGTAAHFIQWGTRIVGSIEIYLNGDYVKHNP